MRLLILCLVSLIFATDLNTVIADDLLQSEKDIITWLDELGYQDFSKTPLIKVSTGSGVESGQEPSSIGFLIAENSADFTVVDLNGTRTTYTTKRADGTPKEAVQFEKLDLMKFVGERIVPRNSPHLSVENGATSKAFQNALLARTCAAKGHNKEAHALFQRAGLQRSFDREGKLFSLIDFLKKDQARTRMKHAILAFGDPKITRPELLRMFENFVQHFPESIHLERAKVFVESLKSMIQEDRDHLAKKLPPDSQLEGEALIAELIFQLRTQRGQQPLTWDLFSDEREAESPAARLISIGFDAMPQLIEAIGDQRFTRLVGYDIDLNCNRNVLRVGDCAAMIVSRTAGREFYRHTATGKRMTKDEAKLTKERVEAWWKEIQTKGEEQVLVEAVKAGDENSVHQAKILFEKFPNLAVDAIRSGLEKPKRALIGQSLISLLVDDGSDKAMELIRQQLTEGSELSIRVHAAKMLTQNGQSKLALDKMLHEWATLSASEKREHFDYDPRTGLAVFLLESGSANAVKGLFKQFAQLPANTQYGVIRPLLDQQLKMDPAYSKAVEAFLVDCLQLNKEVDGFGIDLYGTNRFGDQSLAGLRVCDFAGYVLTQHWPDSYACRLDGTEWDRDASRFAAINHWRQTNGMKPVKVPKPFVAVSIKNEITKPLVDKIFLNESGDASKKALAQLSQFGPGAIEAVKKLSQKIDGSHPFSYEVKQLLRDLPNTITVAQTGNELAAVKQSWLNRINALRGQTFSSEMLANLLADFTKERPCAGVRIKAIRDGDGNGITVTVIWEQELARVDAPSQNWYTSTNVQLGDESLENYVDFVGLEDAADVKNYQTLSKAVKKSLAKPDQAMRVSVSLIINE